MFPGHFPLTNLVQSPTSFRVVNLLAVNRNFLRCVDSKLNRLALNSHDGNHDSVTENHLLFPFSAQDEHRTILLTGNCPKPDHLIPCREREPRVLHSLHQTLTQTKPIIPTPQKINN